MLETGASPPPARLEPVVVLGPPDALATRLGSGAEAVICISNKTLTWQVVHGFEQRGIPAFGPVWDS